MGRIVQFDGRGIGSNCYLFSDDECENAVVIDPSASPETTAHLFGHVTPIIRAILLTHAHADHMLALKKWKEATGAPVLIGRYDKYAVNDPMANVADLLGLPSGDFGEADRGLEDGEVIVVGREKLRVLYTPGHTAGSVCYLSSDALFSGDTIFSLGGVGRTDFFGGSDESLADSVKRILSLPPTVTVYPGHGRKTTVALERIYHAYTPD
ncbi:MAG: MBL fold metallo-hydrolase [Clostridia bacterium]|nr:MBL fold metallo-hydrolase [Clostridia bacterium]